MTNGPIDRYGAFWLRNPVGKYYRARASYPWKRHLRKRNTGSANANWKQFFSKTVLNQLQHNRNLRNRSKAMVKYNASRWFRKRRLTAYHPAGIARSIKYGGDQYKGKRKRYTMTLGRMFKRMRFN